MATMSNTTKSTFTAASSSRNPSTTGNPKSTLSAPPSSKNSSSTAASSSKKPFTTGTSKYMGTAAPSSNKPSTTGITKPTLSAAPASKRPFTTGTSKYLGTAAPSSKKPSITSTTKSSSSTASSSKNSPVSATTKSTTLTAASSSSKPSTTATTKSTAFTAASSSKKPSTTSTTKSSSSTASSSQNSPATATSKSATLTAASSSKNPWTTGTTKSTTSIAASSFKNLSTTGTTKPSSSSASSSKNNSLATGTTKPITLTAVSSSNNTSTTGTTKSSSSSASSSKRNSLATGTTKPITLIAASSSNNTLMTGTPNSTTLTAAPSSTNNSSDTATRKSTTLPAAPSFRNNSSDTTTTKSTTLTSAPSSKNNSQATATPKSTALIAASSSKNTTTTFTAESTVTGKSSQNLSTTDTTTKVKSHTNHHIPHTSDITPYFLTVPTARPYQVAPYYEGLWQRGSPFSLAEENLQYMTFLSDQWQDGLAVAVGGWEDDNGGIMDKGSKSGPSTPPRNQAPRKKITLSAYKRKRAGESGETTPSVGGGDVPPAKKARMSPPPLQPAPTRTPPPPTVAAAAAPTPSAAPAAPAAPTVAPTAPLPPTNLPPLLSPTLPTSVEEELAKERGSSASQPSRETKVVKLRIPRRLQKTVARLLQTKPQPKRPRPDEDETARDPPSKRPRAPHGMDLPHQPRTPIPPPSKSPSFKSQSSHLASANKPTAATTPKRDVKAVAAVALRRPRSGDGDVMTPSGPAAARSGTPTAPPSAEQPKPPVHNASSSSTSTTTTAAAATTTRQEEIAALRADHKRYLALGRDLKHAADALLKPKEPSAITTDCSDAANRGTAIALECVLCYMLAFALADEASHLARHSYGDASSWRSLLPYWAFVESKCQQLPQSPLLHGLVLQLGAVCRDVIHNHDLDRLASDPVPPGEDFADFKIRLVEDARVARTLWQEGTRRLSVDALHEHFPRTWENRAAVPVVGRVKLEPGAYSGDFYLPLSGGGVSSALEAVRVGWAVLVEWCHREGVTWEGRLGL